MEEIWKDIKDYEGLYQVSNLARIRSVERVIVYSDGKKVKYPSKILSHNVMKVLRCYVHLYKNSKRKALLVHRLVAISFINNPNNLPEINHIDGNPCNNQIDNLEWTTRLANMQHGFKTGLINNTGINHGSNIYSEEQIREVKRLLSKKVPRVEITILTGVKKGTIEVVANNKQWTHIKIGQPDDN